MEGRKEGRKEGGKKGQKIKTGDETGNEKYKATCVSTVKKKAFFLFLLYH